MPFVEKPLLRLPDSFQVLHFLPTNELLSTLLCAMPYLCTVSYVLFIKLAYGHFLSHRINSPTPLGRGGAPKRGVHLDPRTKLAAIAAMALAVALAPNVACELALMGLAVAFGCALGKGKASAGTLVLYVASVAVAQLVPYLDNVALRTMLASFFLLVRKVFACGLMVPYIRVISK